MRIQLIEPNQRTATSADAAAGPTVVIPVGVPTGADQTSRHTVGQFTAQTRPIPHPNGPRCVAGIDSGPPAD